VDKYVPESTGKKRLDTNSRPDGIDRVLADVHPKRSTKIANWIAGLALYVLFASTLRQMELSL
jgi:hypothetical protein